MAPHLVEGREVDLLLSHVLEKPLSWLIAHGDDEVGEDQSLDFYRLAALRCDGQPLQYLIGRADFYGRTFSVDERVLIPRPETEFLVEECLRAVVAPRALVIDLGTGSGCIAITLKLEAPRTAVIATDCSLDAILLARENARRLSADVSFVVADLLDAFRGSFSMIVSNPPYIGAEDMSGLQREVLREPHMALTPGPDAYAIYRRLYRDACHLTREDASILVEIGFGQAGEVETIAGDSGWKVKSVVRDLAGIDRVVIAQRAR